VRERILVSPQVHRGRAYDRDGNVVRKFERATTTNNFPQLPRRGARRRADARVGTPPRSKRTVVPPVLHMAKHQLSAGAASAVRTSRRDVFGDKDADSSIRKDDEALGGQQRGIGGLEFHDGARLRFDAENETFGKDDEANAMRTREYREPFVVPVQFE